MRVNLRRRIAIVAALIVPAVAVFALSAFGAYNSVSPLAGLIITFGMAAGLSLLVIAARRSSHAQSATVSAIPVAASSPTARP